MGRKKLTQEDFINRIKSILGENYSFGRTVYHDSHTKVVITCKKHGDFLIRPCDILSKDEGCPECAKEKISITKKDTKQKFIHKAEKKYGTEYLYDLVEYSNSRTPVYIICKKHGKFSVLPYYFLLGHSCPECSTQK